MKSNWQSYLASLCAFLCISGAAFSQELTQEKFEKLHQELKPTEKDVWRTIPWKVQLLDAQKLAAKEKKPIFIWAMDGHPLGCT